MPIPKVGTPSWTTVVSNLPTSTSGQQQLEQAVQGAANAGQGLSTQEGVLALIAQAGPLTLGTTGRTKEIKVVQGLLSTWAQKYGSTVDKSLAKKVTSESGTYGASTEQLVRNYQTAKKLQVDGVVGQQTLGSLLGAPYPIRGGVNMLSQSATSAELAWVDAFEADYGK
jgi:peptidoglycan hydrolase-like protein with peptidoglycan-binding domain